MPTTTIEIPTESVQKPWMDWSLLKLPPRKAGLACLAVYKAPNVRPPILSEMMPDASRLISSVAKKFSRNSSPYLNYEDMVGEGNLKLAELIDRGEEERQPTRLHFFKLLKTSLQNQAKSRIQKYEFTEKRTGVKPPPRLERAFHAPSEVEEDVAAAEETHRLLNAEEAKRPQEEGLIMLDVDRPLRVTELSLDDPDMHVQVADTSSTAQSQQWNDLVEDYAAQLGVMEAVVFHQMLKPNELAFAAAFVDSFIGKMAGKVSVKIKHRHLAVGLGIAEELFNEAVLSIRQKIRRYRNMSEQEHEEQARKSAIIAQLKIVFGVQIPPSADDMMIRRLFTIAARDQYTKLSVQVVELLESIGAKVPRIHKTLLSCYGVLYSAVDKRCAMCGLRKSCFVEASNLGLNIILLSPKLLGSRQPRNPIMLPTSESEVQAPDVKAAPEPEPAPATEASTYDESEVLNYLNENFTPYKRKDGSYYGLETGTLDQSRPLFCIGRQSVPLQIRFCSPSSALKAKLVCKSKAWCPPEGAAPQEIMALIDQHAQEVLNG